MSWLLVFVGGGAGSLCRYGLSLLFPPGEAGHGLIPWATFLANGLACLILGAGIALATRNAMPKEMALLLLTGFCGGFSTFSTFTAELFALYQAGAYGTVIGYLTLKMVTGLLALWVGFSLLK